MNIILCNPLSYVLYGAYLMKKIISVLLTSVLFLSTMVLFSGCSANTESKVKNNDKLSIVTTIFPYYDFTRNITGDKADIKLLLSPGSEPHDYEPSPADVVAIENCDIFIYNGGESDEWVESVLESLQNKNIKIMCMIDYINPLFEHNPDHSLGDEYDEHIWTSVKNSQSLVGAIAESAKNVDAQNSDFYSQNAENYIEKLKGLDTKFQNIADNGVRKDVVFGDRFPFLYFMTDYNLSYECAFPGCSSETEPSIAIVTHLIDYVEEQKIPVVFYLDFSNGKTAELIAEDTGAKVLQFQSCHNVTKEQFENGEDYISLMEQNALALKEALS